MSYKPLLTVAVLGLFLAGCVPAMKPTIPGATDAAAKPTARVPWTPRRLTQFKDAIEYSPACNERCSKGLNHYWYRVAAHLPGWFTNDERASFAELMYIHGETMRHGPPQGERAPGVAGALYQHANAAELSPGTRKFYYARFRRNFGELIDYAQAVGGDELVRRMVTAWDVGMPGFGALVPRLRAKGTTDFLPRKPAATAQKSQAAGALAKALAKQGRAPTAQGERFDVAKARVLLHAMRKAHLAQIAVRDTEAAQREKFGTRFNRAMMSMRVSVEMSKPTWGVHSISNKHYAIIKPVLDAMADELGAREFARDLKKEGK